MAARLHRSFVPFAVLLLALGGCAAEAGHVPSVNCGELCEAEVACLPEVREGYLEDCLKTCAALPASCREEMAGECLSCYRECGPDCDAACHCEDLPGKAGDPCRDDDDCMAGTICIDGTYCVGDGPLRITLSFDVDSDFDLHLRTPAGNDISYVTDAADGGTLDVDQCIYPCGEGGHLENIVFRGVAPVGTYEVWAVNHDGRRAGAFRIAVVRASGTDVFTGTLPATTYASSPHFTFIVHGDPR